MEMLLIKCAVKESFSCIYYLFSIIIKLIKYKNALN